jgi:glycerate kinase
MVAFLSATMRPGVDIVLETVGLKDQLVGADLVITGEGQTDFQTIYKKAPIGVAEMAKKNDIPVIAISGSLGERFQVVHDHGIDAAAAITTAPMTLEEASEHAFDLIASETEEALRFLKTGAKVFGKR